MNMNPLLEYDGYYILSDFLNRPNLRQQSLEWLGKYIRFSVDRHLELRRHWFDLGYGMSSIVYIVFMAYSFVISYRIVLEVHLRSFLPDIIASALPVLIAALIVISASVTIIGEMKAFQYRRGNK